MPGRETERRNPNQLRLYRQATTPGCSTFSLNVWLPLGSSAGTSCGCVATTLPFASRKSKMILSGGDDFGRTFVICPPRGAPLSLGGKTGTVISTPPEPGVVTQTTT